LAFAIGAGFSGVVLYSYYQYRLNQTNDRVNALISGYQKAFANAEGNLNATASKAKADLQTQIGAFRQEVPDPTTMAALVKQLAPSMFFVHTLDQNGAASVGSAFVIASNSSQSLLLTSYTTVAAVSHSPAPAVYVRQGSTDTQVAVRSWDQRYDLAVIVLPRGNLAPIVSAPTTPALQLGQRVYALSGLGSAGASISQGDVTDVSASGLAHDAPTGAAFQGGPILNASGQVVAVASRAYAPLGFTTDGVWYAPYVGAACAKILTCPGGSLSAAS
jgi:S1-C subfamily serine protease